MTPDGAPEHLGEREALWNAVEAKELRKDAQLAREIEFAIPREMSEAQGIELARDFVQREFVTRGMIADLNVHWDQGADGLIKPHAHVMLTMREVGEDGFGAKVRDWNKTELVAHWREAWADHVNQRLAALDIDARIDHRSLEAQGVDLEPQNKIGPAAARRGVEGRETERLDEHAQIARRNGEKIIADPNIALDAITRNQATFTRRDLAMFVHRHSDDKDQFDRAMSAVQASSNLVELGRDGKGNERFTSREMIAVETRLQRASQSLAERERHRVGEKGRERALASAQARGLALSGEQRAAFDHVTDRRSLSVVVGYAGTGKSAMLGVAREAWEASGHQVRGAALSGIAAENLESGSGIASRTIASLEHQWGQGRDLLTQRDLLVIDEAGMIGSRQMERVLTAAEHAGAKVVLVGDPEQLQAIEAGGGVPLGGGAARRGRDHPDPAPGRRLGSETPPAIWPPVARAKRWRLTRTMAWFMPPIRAKRRGPIWSIAGIANGSKAPKRRGSSSPTPMTRFRASMRRRATSCARRVRWGRTSRFSAHAASDPSLSATGSCFCAMTGTSASRTGPSARSNT